MYRDLKIAEEEKYLINLKNHELDRLYHELRETIALKEELSKKIKDHVIFKKFMNTVFKYFYYIYGKDFLRFVTGRCHFWSDDTQEKQ